MDSRTKQMILSTLCKHFSLDSVSDLIVVACIIGLVGSCSDAYDCLWFCSLLIGDEIDL